MPPSPLLQYLQIPTVINYYKDQTPLGHSYKVCFPTLWVPGHTGIADQLTKSTIYLRCPFGNKILWFDFNPNLKICIDKIWPI